MDLTNKYILRSWANSFTLVTGFLSVLFICQSVYNFLLDLIRAGETFGGIINYFFIDWLILLPLLFPISFFVSILITFLELQKSNQLTALKSFGFSLIRLSLPLWLVGALISVFVYFISSAWIPNLVEKKNQYIEQLNSVYDSEGLATKSQTLTYENFISRRLWFIEDFNYRESKGAYSVLHQMNASGNEVSRIIANSSAYDSDLNTWVFLEGTELLFDPISGDPLRSIKFQNKQFVDLEENPSDFQLFNKNPNELSLFQLNRLLDLIPESIGMRKNILIEVYALLFNPFASILFVGLSIPFISRASVRGSQLKGVFKSVLVVFTFFISVSLSKNFGTQLNLPALFIVIAPYLLYAGFTVRLYWRQ